MAKDLITPASQFFCDPEAFTSLAEVGRSLMGGHAEDLPLRIWVPDCSTGEETYSLGIILLEQIAAARRPMELQIFATDIDDAALQIARNGAYPESIRTYVSPKRLNRFFTREDRDFKVAANLRQAVIFRQHNLLDDPPFSQLDLVFCPNLLIYLKPETQRRVLTLLHYSLRDRGVLFLGSAESVSLGLELFEPVNVKFHIYRRRGSMQTAQAGFTKLEDGRPAPELSRSATHEPIQPPPLADLAQRMMIEAYAPPAVVTNRLFLPLYYVGATDRYLRIVPGEPHQDILSMAREDLRAKLRETVMKAFRRKRRVCTRCIDFQRAGRAERVMIDAQPIMYEHNDLMLVSFIDEVLFPAKTGRRRGKAAESSVSPGLRKELAQSRRELKRTIHELSRANAELKAKNEEAIAVNEQFLSANEEFESSKGELRSRNEQLTRVNSELRESLEAQKQASTDLTNLLSSSAAATILLDAELRIKMFNPRANALFSFIDSDIGRPLAELLPKFADSKLQTDTAAAFSRGTSSEREIRGQAGTWYLRSVVPYRTSKGDLQGAAVTFADISRLKQTERDAVAARRYAEMVIDSIGDPLVVLDSEFKVVTANSAFRAQFPSTSEKMVGDPLCELRHPLLSHSQVEGLLARVLANEQGLDRIEIEAGHTNENFRVWRANGRRFQLPNAERPMVLLTLHDITVERYIVRKQLQLVLDALPEASIAVDDRRLICFVSKQVEELFGYCAEELVGQPAEILVPPEGRAEHAKLHAAFMANPVARPMGSGLDINGVGKDGRQIPLDIGLVPVVTVDGLLMVATIHDLRPERESERRLRQSRAVADRVSEAKTRFFAAASHDLRQPLQTIGLLHGVLENGAVDSKSREVLGKLDQTVSDMTALLDTLLDASQIESGAIKPHVADFPVAGLLKRVCDDFGPLATAKGLDFRCVESSATIFSDPGLLARMLRKLFSNAVKYTERGRVLVGCRCRGDTLRIEVWGTGIDISPNEVDSVLDEFYRADRFGSVRGVLALDLYIVQRFAALLDHKVDVRSKVGCGTMFCIVVPRADARLPQGEPRTNTDVSDPTILLIEDNSDQLEALRALLELEGYHIVQAHNGDDALVRLGELSPLRPDVVIADYNLGTAMSGPEAVEQLRSRLGAQIPVLILSGDKSVGALEAVEAKGHPVIYKPVRAADLLAAVETLVRTTKPGWVDRGTPSRTLGLPSRTGGQAAVAVIDDDPGVREAIRMALETQGTSVATYASAETFLADPDHRRFRCIVIDLVLVGMDGLQLQSWLKSERLNVPIIFITGRGDLAMAVKAMREGAADFLQKPVRSAELRESVTSALKAGRQGGRGGVDPAEVTARLDALTLREKQIMERMLLGEATKNIAAALGISQRTAEHHRHSVMRKMGVKSLAVLVRMVGPLMPDD